MKEIDWDKFDNEDMEFASYEEAAKFYGIGSEPLQNIEKYVNSLSYYECKKELAKMLIETARNNL